MLDPPVKIQQARTVIKDKFCRPCQPVIEKLFCRIRSGIQVLRICLRHGWPVKIPFFSGSWISLSNVFPFPRKTSVPHGGRCTEMNSPLFASSFSSREHPVSVPCRPRSNRKDHSGTSEIHHDVPLPETHNRLLPPETVPSTPPGKNVQPETSE